MSIKILHQTVFISLHMHKFTDDVKKMNIDDIQGCKTEYKNVEFMIFIRFLSVSRKGKNVLLVGI